MISHFLNTNFLEKSECYTKLIGLVIFTRVESIKSICDTSTGT